MTFPHSNMVGFLKPKGIAYSPEFQDILTYWNGSGWLLPDAPTCTIFDTMVTSLVTDGIWAKMEFFDFFSTHNQNCSLTNWATAGATFNPTAVNAPAWAAYQGFTGAVTGTKYIRSNFIPTTNGTKIGQDNICAIIGVGTDLEQNKFDFGGYNTSLNYRFYIASKYAGPTAQIACNANNANSFYPNTNGKNYYAMSRGNSANFDQYRNLTKINNIRASVGLIDCELYICAIDYSGTSAAASDHQLRFALLSSYLTETEVTNAINAIETCLDALGGFGLIP